VHNDSEILYLEGQVSEATVFFEICAKFRRIRILVIIYVKILFSSRSTPGSSGGMGIPVRSKFDSENETSVKNHPAHILLMDM